MPCPSPAAFMVLLEKLRTYGGNKNISLNKENFKRKVINIFSYPSVLTFVLGAQKNCLIETVLLSTDNISFD